MSVGDYRSSTRTVPKLQASVVDMNCLPRRLRKDDDEDQPLPEGPLLFHAIYLIADFGLLLLIDRQRF